MTAAPVTRTTDLDAPVLKRVLGRFCTGIAVITADTDGGSGGFTCQVVGGIGPLGEVEEKGPLLYYRGTHRALSTTCGE